ncbi:MAG: hypothetical protein ACLUE8_01620 [Lachnospiraceae bacterium]
MCDFLRQDGLSMDMLARLSFKSELGLSLKKKHWPLSKTGYIVGSGTSF